MPSIDVRMSKGLTLLFIALLISTGKGVCQDDVFSATIRLPRQHTTIYQIFNQITQQTGYFFIYDSELVNSNRRVRLGQTRQDLKSLLRNLVDDPQLEFKAIDTHILIYNPRKTLPEIAKPPVDTEIPMKPLVINGRVLDRENRSALPFASVGFPEKGIGVFTNADGRFRLIVPPALLNSQIRVSYMGYRSQQLPVALFSEGQVDVLLETELISMQEVIIRYFDPEAIVREALKQKSENFSPAPRTHYSFYREAVLRNQKVMNYSEAIFKIHKAAYNNPFEHDELQLLKSRKIVNTDNTDTLLLKIEAGVKSALELDIMKNMPDFLEPRYMENYKFIRADIVTFRSRTAYAIEFVQADHIRTALHMGILYIDMETLAFLGADFEVNPKYINNSQFQFFTKRSREYIANIERVFYTVSYAWFDGSYHLQHVRGDLKMRFRRKNRFFSTQYEAFLEMATGKIDSLPPTSRIPLRERFHTHVIFADMDQDYDYSFWGEYNIIPPELHISESLMQIRAKIESIISEESSPD